MTTPPPDEKPCPHDQVKLEATGSGRWKSCLLYGRRVEYVCTRNGKVIRDSGFTGFARLCNHAARALWVVPPGYKPAERVEVHDALALLKETRGRLIAGSGCKRSVAGKSWHEDTHAWLAEKGCKASEEPCDHKFRVGYGRLVSATKSWRYPCGIHGYSRTLSTAEVPKDCPPLLSVTGMKEVGVVLDFQKGEISANDRREPMKMLDSGHPVLDMDA